MSFLVFISKEHLIQLKKVAKSVQNNVNQKNLLVLRKLDHTPS